jgi:hypothetical protein
MGLTIAFLYPSVDSYVCMSKTAKTLNVHSDFDSIRERIILLLQPGLTRDKVHKTLESIAPTSVRNYTENIDEVVVHTCSFPLNNFVFLLSYTPDGKLIKAEYEYLDN